MVRNQGDVSFLSWTSTLHPETAFRTVTNPSHFHNQNPLVAVYHEISADDADFEGVPVAVQVVAVDDPDDHEENDFEMGRNSTNNNQEINTQHLHQRNDDLPAQAIRPQPWRHSNLIDLILGFILFFTAIIVTLKIEFAAFLLYLLAAFFNYLAEDVLGGHPILALFRNAFLLVTAALMLTDSILLMVNVLVTEILGAVALFLCTLSGGTRSGTEWHMFIRRTCHLTRWGLRRCLTTGWKPDRIFPIPENIESSSFRSPHRSSSGTCGGVVDIDSVQGTGASSEQYEHIGCNSQNLGYHDENVVSMDDHTLISTFTMTTTAAVLPTVDILPENVHILDDSDTLPVSSEGANNSTRMHSKLP